MRRPHTVAVSVVSLLAASLFSLTNAFASDSAGAVAACRKHIESKLHEAIRTSYDSGMDVRPVDDRTVAVAGRFTSQSKSGQTTSADFRCQAKRYGVLWTTSMQLMPR